MKNLMLIVLALSLAACLQKDNGVRVSIQQPPTKVVAPAPVARTEPVFYNGKTYRMNLAPQANGLFELAVDGMSAGQQKDAVAVATSSLRYFGCAEGKTGKLTNTPSYLGGRWKMAARCG